MAKELIAVDGDGIKAEAGHAGTGGELEVEGDKTVFINKKAIVTHQTKAKPDDQGHTEEEVKTKDKSFSETVFAYKKHVHRNNDERNCGAKTKVTNQENVFCG